MVEKSGESPWHLLLWPLPQRYTREEIYSYYRHASDITKFQVLETPDGKRMGALQMKTGLDLMVSSCRFLAEGDTKMPHFIVQQPLQSLHEWMKTPFHIRVSFERTSDESLPDKLLNLFKKCGNVALLSQHSDCERDEWMLEVDAAYQLGQICTGTSFMFGATKVQLEFFEDFIEEQIAARILANAEEVVNRLEHYYQGLGLFVKTSVSTLTEDNPQRIDYQHLVDDREEMLESLFEDEETEDTEYVFDPSKVYGRVDTFAETLRGLPALLPTPPTTVRLPLAAEQRPELEQPKAAESSEQVQQPHQICWDDLVRQPDIEDRVLDAVDRLTSNGIVIDSRFIEGVEAKISPDTPKTERLRAILKIVKTKVRKLKRRDKRKQPKTQNSLGQAKESGNGFAVDSDDESDDQDPLVKRDNTKIRYKKCTADEVTGRYARYGFEWVRFLSENLVRVHADETPPKVTTCSDGADQQQNSPKATLSETAPDQLAAQELCILDLVKHQVERREWYNSFSLSDARGLRPPVGWPDCYHPNLRLNPRRTYGYKFARPFNNTQTLQ